MINSPRAAFFGVRILHGDAPAALSSSANKEDFDPGAGLGSSSNRELRDLELTAAGEGSSGDDPNSDIVAECLEVTIDTREEYLKCKSGSLAEMFSISDVHARAKPNF